MLIKYYKNKNLSYANRKRFFVFNFEHFFEEEQKSVLLGDGANTSIKTSKNNICDYVKIDETRWFVTSYVYCNGGQVILNLQRDVVGEFGLNDCFGKIERGYTDTVLKNRKELSLNQVLKERKKIQPISNTYGNYTVNTHEDEMWGVLYIAKPTDGQNNVNINIPEFNPRTVEYDFIENGTKKVSDVYSDAYFSFTCGISGSDLVHRYTIKFKINAGDKKWSYDIFHAIVDLPAFFVVNAQPVNPLITLTDKDLEGILGNAVNKIAKSITEGKCDGVYKLPDFVEVEENIIDYNNVTIKKDDVFYSYKTSIKKEDRYGQASVNNGDLYINTIRENLNNSLMEYPHRNEDNTFTNVLVQLTVPDNPNYIGYIHRESKITISNLVYNNFVVSKEEAGQIAFEINQQLVDEPFVIVVCPLYDVIINDNINIKKANAFNVFNTVIQSLSGENGYIVDAQIYPYCPVLVSNDFTIRGLPFFSINSTSYNHDCVVDLMPLSDVKKEYIERTYSIISPEKSGKFDFNFYDYKTKINDLNGNNIESIKIKIKTALKPFSIISSAVIIPDEGSLKGITYESDLRGCSPAGNGFQCSLSSNAFETYKRQNSNYQQIFALQKEELSLNHATERVNEKTNAIISTVNATVMGGMAGAAAGDSFFGNIFGAKAIGAGIGAGAAGATVGIAQNKQMEQNDKLRAFEKTLQQQMFDLEIGTIKNLPNSVSRISSFNEIILKDFYYVVEIYECTNDEKEIVDNFISKYSYGIGAFDYVLNYVKDGWFIRSTVISSSFPPNLQNIASNELMGGIYIYE